LRGGARISSSTFGAGHGGDVTVQASEALTITGRNATGNLVSGLFSATSGSGTAGRVTVSARALSMGDGIIDARALSGSSGDAGSIVFTAGSLNLRGGARIDPRTAGSGRGGLVVVTATDTVSIAGRDRDGNLSGLVSLTSSATAGAGDAGMVLLAAPHIQLTEGGQIQTSTSGAGTAGTIVVGAFEQQVAGMTIRGPEVVRATLT